MAWFQRRAPAPRRWFRTWIIGGGISVKGTGSMRITINLGQTVTLRVRPTDDSGVMGCLGAPLAWNITTADGAPGVQMVVASDCLSAALTGVSPGEVAALTISDGAIAEEHEVVVTVPRATRLNLTVEGA